MGARVKVLPTPIAGAVVVETRPHQDTRGAFTRLFCADALRAVMGPRQIVKINQSRTLHAVPCAACTSSARRTPK